MRPQLTLILAAVLALAISGCAKANTPADTFTVGALTAETYGQPTTGRVFLFHPLNSARAAMYDQIDGYTSRGYQVVITDEPYDHAAPNQGEALRAAFLSDSTAGQAYRDLWANATHDMIATADARYGPAPRLLMAGISWGGFSALLAACSNPQVDGYVVTIPASDPNGLPEWADVPLANLKLTAQGCSDRLASMPGFIAWGDQDTRVGTTGTRALVAELAGSVTNCEYPMGHSVPQVTIRGMMRWVDGARDCLPYVADPVAPAQSAPVTAPAAAPAASVSPASHTAAPVHPAAKRARCGRSNHCRTVVRRGKVYRVYNRHGKKPRWVYVRPAKHR